MTGPEIIDWFLDKEMGMPDQRKPFREQDSRIAGCSMFSSTNR